MNMLNSELMNIRFMIIMFRVESLVFSEKMLSKSLFE